MTRPMRVDHSVKVASLRWEVQNYNQTVIDSGE